MANSSLSEALRDRYRLERELGRGGMATVYLARDLKHDRQVALKVLHSELGATLGPERFLREIHTAARLQHPHILPVHDSGESVGLLWYTMPFVEGESLRACLDRERQLPVDEAVRITREVAEALHYAHTQGIVHRDVKPENILLSRGHALLTDLGIARTATPGRLTETGLALGTPAYMSPEQVGADQQLDARSDVYGLGCVLYEMLVGEPPYTGPSAQAIVAKHLAAPIPRGRTVRPDTPEHVDKAIQRALAKSPAARFGTAADFAAALGTPQASRFRRTVVAGMVAVIASLGFLIALRDHGSKETVKPKLNSVAVIPFLNLTGDAESDYFSNGVTEDITSHLGRIRDLKVIAHTSALKYKGRTDTPRVIGEALGVATLLQGSVRRAGDRVRVTARLVNAPTGEQLWADEYDRELRDVFGIQRDIAERITASLRGALSPQERARLTRQPTTDPQAYNLYLLGRHHFGKFNFAGWRRSIEYFQQAIARDSTFALAYAALADTKTFLAYLGLARPQDVFPEARAAALKAIKLDSTLGEAHASLGVITAAYDWDRKSAETSFRHGLTLSPNSVWPHIWYAAFVLSPSGRHDEAIDEMKQAVELDPVSLQVRFHLGMSYYFARRHESAITEFQRALDLDPNFSPARNGLGFTYAALGRFEEAIPEMRQAVTDSTTTSDAVLGYVYALAGRVPEARTILRSLGIRARHQYVIPLDFSLLYTGLGERDQAFRWLRKAYEERHPLLVAFWGAPTYDLLRDDPRAAVLTRDLGMGGGSPTDSSNFGPEK